MPFKPPRPCNTPGCPRLTYRRFCDEHFRAHHATFNREQRPENGSAAYWSNWRKAAKIHLAEEPLCRSCLAEGREVAATEVDHIVPRARGGTSDEENLQSLCKRHHSAKTAGEVLNA